MIATIVTSNKELEQIVELSQKNMRANFTDAEQNKYGFLTWNYSFELLQLMNEQHPHVIVKDDNNVIAYARVALKKSVAFHANIKAMILQLDALTYKSKSLAEYKYYVIGQVCVDADYRGKGVFEMMYLQHKALLEKEFDFVITEISTSNKRSLRAHEKMGFKTIYTYSDAMDEWNVVIWEWNNACLK